MTRFKDKCVLITGGGSGIGRIMGRLALERGARKVVVWDIDERNIAASLAAYAAPERTAGYRADVSDRRQVEETFARTTAVNATAPMYLTLQALPGMLERNEGHICNIASAAGMISNPRMSVYAASKWAVIGWSDSLRIELQEARSGVHVTTVAPYYIATGMFAGVRSRLVPILDPEKTARRIVRAVERNRTFRGLPWGFHFIRLVQGLLPDKLFDALVGNAMGIYRTMDHFTGRRTPDHTSNR
ncbi:MAG TPA: SDR family NAD(P)-dependent oxidoreductase [Candidatus Alistipes avistercoris]|nr:SDR family NAD(P)-dependent oxidoreductase [Candidatus Alistipes avistercoris]